MADAKWIKVAIDMFNDPKLKIINSMEEKDLINYVWMRSLLLAGRSNMNGCFYINETMPYTLKTLAIEFDRNFEDIKLAFKVLRKLEMIEVTENRVFRVKNWSKHQSVDELEKLKKQNCERVAKHRAKKKEIEEKNNNITEIDIDKENSDSKTINEQKGNRITEKIEDTTNGNNKDNKGVQCNNNSNITCNVVNEECNITVMEQNKKEKKNKKKNIREIENNDVSVNDVELVSRKENSSQIDIAKTSELDNSVLSTNAIKLLQYYEQLTGILGGLDVGSLRLAINTHGEENVKKAIDEAIEVGSTKANMRYINGILRNWRKEGYPEDDVGGINNGAKSNGKSSRADSNEFKGIKPKKCRELTEEERKKLGADLV